MFDYIEYIEFIDDEKRKKKKGPGIKKKKFFFPSILVVGYKTYLFQNVPEPSHQHWLDGDMIIRLY